MPEAMTKMVIRIQADGVGLSRATVHPQGNPRYRVGSAARANRHEDTSADCKFSPMS